MSSNNDLLKQYLPSRPPSFTGGFLTKGGNDHPDRRKSLEKFVETTDDDSLRKKAQEMLDGKRSTFELFRDPDFGAIIAKGLERAQEFMDREGIDVSDPQTHPSAEQWEEYEATYGTSSEGEDPRSDHDDQGNHGDQRSGHRDDQEDRAKRALTRRNSDSAESADPSDMWRATRSLSFGSNGSPSFGSNDPRNER